jgi:P pilus assembly chaperone PapD
VNHKHKTCAGIKAIRGVINGVLMGLAAWLLSLGLILMAASAIAPAKGAETTMTVRGAGLIISPTRIELKSTEVASRVLLKNRSNETVTYDIDWVPLMDHEKHAKDIATSIIYFPRRVTLEPGAVQTIRLLIEAPYGGSEERGRLRVQTAPTEAPKVTQNVSKPTAGVRVLYGVSIPLVRGAK